jgi:hypothetical protein
MIHKGKQPKMQEKFQVYKFKELLMSQQQLLWLMVCKRNKIKLLQFMI